jgi:puromycin-sensitive aminopeptidase
MTTEATRTKSPTPDEARWRLPTALRPSRYEIHLAPDMGSSTFKGDVRIECTVFEPTSEIVLNAAELTIDDVKVEVESGAGARPVGVSGTSVDEDSERLTIALSETVSSGGSILVRIGFTGILNDQLRGFYRSVFSPPASPDGTIETIATTHFESTDARRAFPCFDEPDRKAVFAVTVDVPPGLSVFSNWSVASEEPLEGGARRVRFGDSMKMSTYLVCIVVGPFVQTEPIDVDGIPVSIVHVPGKEGLADFALEAAAHSLRFFTDWFGIPYPADKLDMIALPDFAMGAMENLGCITYRESALLVDPARASLAELNRVALVVAHEIAHMWFGDLVTMRWWDGIWLNEAFATLMETLCIDAFRPDWDQWTIFGTRREMATAIDGLHTTRPVEFPVASPQEAEAMFDPLTYEKGGGVLRMLERYIGAEKFRDGIRIYLTRHAYGNTDSPDLWAALEESSGEPVGMIMDSWLHEGGFPLVKVADGAEAGGRLRLTQVPFMYRPVPAGADIPGGGSSAIGTSWKIPALLRTSGVGEPGRALIEDDGLEVELVGNGPAIANAGGAGYFRVQYPKKHLFALAGRLGDLTTLERFNLVADQWAAVVSGHGELADFLLLAAALASESAPERDPDVWGQVTNALTFIDRALPEAVRPQLAEYVIALIGPVLRSLRWEAAPEDSERLRSLRSQLVSVLGIIGADPDVRAKCATSHREFLDGRAELDPDLAPAIVAVVASFGGAEEYDAFFSRYSNPSTPQEEIRYLYALASFPGEDLGEKTFDLARSKVRVQYTSTLITFLLANRSTGSATWDRLTDNWDDLIEKIPEMLVSRMIDGVRFLCRDPKLTDQIASFLDEHHIASGQRSVDQTLERLLINTALASRLAETAGATLAAATAALAEGAASAAAADRSR